MVLGWQTSGSPWLTRQPFVAFAVYGLFCPPQQLVEVACAKQAVVIHRMAELGDFALTAPVAQSVATDPKVLGRF